MMTMMTRSGPPGGHFSGRRTARRPFRPGAVLAGGLVLGLTWCWTGGAFGQAYIHQGHAFDANLRQGSAGLNLPRPARDFSAANRIMGGTVGGGQAFSGFSPVRDRTSLFLNRSLGGVGATTGLDAGLSDTLWTSDRAGAAYALPSDSLFRFQRDSYGVQDARVRPGRVGREGALPYYSPGAVLSTGDIVAGVNRPGTSQIRSPHELPQSIYQGRDTTGSLLSESALTTPSLHQVQPMVTRLDTGREITGPVNERLIESSLFSHVRMVPAAELAYRAEWERAGSSPMRQPLDLRVGAESVAQADPGWVDRRTYPGETGPIDGLLDREPGAMPYLPGDAQRVGMADRYARGEFLPATGDVFTGMQRATGQLLRPLREDPADRLGEDHPDLADAGMLIQPREEDVESADAPHRARLEDLEMDVPVEVVVPAEPIRTFVGTEESVINAYLAEAEKDLREGQYYRAARTFEMARVIDPGNPLPLLGQAMAYLAAGDYLSSANRLFQAIERFEALSQFRIDLEAFIPDVAAMDRRRADLERRLEAGDDYRLRFLLGYAEFHSGLEERGIAEMSRAAADAPAALDVLRRFARDLEDRFEPGDPEPAPVRVEPDPVP